MKQLFSLTTLGLTLALGSAQAQTVASAPASAALMAPASSSLSPATAPASPVVSANAAAPRPLSRTSRTRGKVVRVLPMKVCSVRVNAQKGQDRTASLSACIKE